MTRVFRKTLKGTEEIAFRNQGLSQRLRPYLLLADGKSSLAELQGRAGGLPALDVVMQSLLDQGFVEEVPQAAGAAAAPATNVIDLKVGNGQAVAVSAGLAAAPVPTAAPAVARAPTEFEQIRLAMSRDCLQLLGKDATQVVVKLHHCQNVNDLFVTMMGIKKIVALYAGDAAAEKFEMRYRHLSSL